MKAVLVILLTLMTLFVTACTPVEGTMASLSPESTPPAAVDSTSPPPSDPPVQEEEPEDGDHTALNLYLTELTSGAELIDAYEIPGGPWWMMHNTNDDQTVESFRLSADDYEDEVLIARIQRLYPAAKDIRVQEEDHLSGMLTYPCKNIAFETGGNEDTIFYRGACVYTDPWTFIFLSSAYADWLDEEAAMERLNSLDFSQESIVGGKGAPVEVAGDIGQDADAQFEAVYIVKQLMAQQYLGDDITQDQLKYRLGAAANSAMTYEVNVDYPDGTSRVFAVNEKNELYEMDDAGDYQLFY